jgi:hypothetical protein
MATWDVLQLQRTLFARIAEYVDGVGQLAASGIMEPGEWMRDYTKLWSGVIGDVGEFVLGATPAAAHVPVPTYAVQVPANEGRPVRFVVPPAAFPGDAKEVEITTAGLVKRGGGKVLAPPRHLRLVPRIVPKLDGHAELKIFPLRDVVERGERYSGFVWTEPAGVPIAAIDVEIM